MAKRYRVTLTGEERERLRALARKGKPSARAVRRALTLLLADDGRTDEAIAAALHSGLSTVARTRQRFVEEGLEAALVERPRPGAAPKLTPKQQAFVVVLACTRPPDGHLPLPRSDIPPGERPLVAGSSAYAPQPVAGFTVTGRVHGC